MAEIVVKKFKGASAEEEKGKKVEIKTPQGGTNSGQITDRSGKREGRYIAKSGDRA